MKKIIIGARGSKLSLAQTELVKKPLQKLLPDAEIVIQVITTTGDKDMSPVPLDTVGKGWFTKELDRALLDGTIDIAVHSLKDIPEELPEGLIIAAIPEREDAREAMVSRKNVLFENLKKGAVVGTDSTRRRSQILHMRPDLVVKSLRGNVNRRLQKLEDGEYDAIFLAVAGLKRLGLASKITEYFDATEFIPSPGQGALAVVVRKSNKDILKIVEKLNDHSTIVAVEAERAFSKYVGGGCKMPVGAYATMNDGSLTLTGMIGSPDGKHVEKAEKRLRFTTALVGTSCASDLAVAPITQAKSDDAEKLGETLAKKLLKICEPWYNAESHGYIVVTRPQEDTDFIKKLQYMNVQVFPYPTIKIVKNILSKKEVKELESLEDYDWIIFTSRHGVIYFVEEMKRLGLSLKSLENTFIAAVGPKTAKEAEKYGLTVHFLPTEFTTEDLAKELKNVKGKRILLARSQIASHGLTEELKKKGAIVTNIPIYNTKFVGKQTPEFEQIVNEGSITCLSFTSPSTVDGFMESLSKDIKEKVLRLPILSIGPVTTKTIEKYGFTKIFTAEIHTIDGMINKIQESIL